MDKQTRRWQREIIVTTSVTIASAIVSKSIPLPLRDIISTATTTTIDSTLNIGSDGGGGGGDGGGDSDGGGGDGGGGTAAPTLRSCCLLSLSSVDVAVPQCRCAVGGRGRCQMVKRKRIRERSDTHKG